ncbi:MAG: hypothetical protein JSR33_11065 [Proteobacteria bacterium]|nr:hypothetical protein [Pseudomonadota bacterium]
MKRFLTTSNNLFKNQALGRAFIRTTTAVEAKSPVSDHQRHTHSLTFQDKIAFLAHDHHAMTMLEEELHVSHSVFEKMLDNIINTIPNLWARELQSIKALWDINRGSEAIRKCDALIKEIEAYPVYLPRKASQILSEAYIFKGDFLRLTGALEKQAQQAFDCYKKALDIVPENQAAKDGVENLRIIRGESTKIIVEEPDSEISSFKY